MDTELFVTNFHNGDSHKFIFDGNIFRHYFDGRAVDVDYWKLEEGNAVNMNVAHTFNHGTSWELISVAEVVKQANTPMA